MVSISCENINSIQTDWGKCVLFLEGYWCVRNHLQWKKYGSGRPYLGSISSWEATSIRYNSGDVVDGGSWSSSSDGISRPKSHQTKHKNFPIRQEGCSGSVFAKFSRGTSANMLWTRFLCHAILSISVEQSPHCSWVFRDRFCHEACH